MQPDDGPSYDADEDGHLEEWLDIDEGERIALVADYHRRKRLPVGETARGHATIHVVVENQLAMGAPAETRATLSRLRAAGVSRHEAVHAIGSVIAEHMHALLQGKGKHDPARFDADLRALKARDWK